MNSLLSSCIVSQQKEKKMPTPVLMLTADQIAHIRHSEINILATRCNQLRSFAEKYKELYGTDAAAAICDNTLGGTDAVGIGLKRLIADPNISFPLFISFVSSFNDAIDRLQSVWANVMIGRGYTGLAWMKICFPRFRELELARDPMLADGLTIMKAEIDRLFLNEVNGKGPASHNQYVPDAEQSYQATAHPSEFGNAFTKFKSSVLVRGPKEIQ